MNTPLNGPLVLVILDGWGYREETDANAIAQATKPTWDKLWATQPHTLISGSGKCVGLPDGQMGNSEVGHLNMGAGRIVHQDLTRVDSAIADGCFNQNPTLCHALETARKHNKAVHILGLLSPGGVHSHENQIEALVNLAAEKNISHVYLHAFLDGRDTPPKSAEASLGKLENHCNKVQCGTIISLIGRYYAMDRDNRWDRTEKAYNLLTSGQAERVATDALTGLKLAYQHNETDEFVKPTRIGSANEAPVTINDGDVVIFMNFRADRARQLTRAFTDDHFTHFSRLSRPSLAAFVTLTEYDNTINASVAFPPEPLTNIFAEYISQKGLSQLRLAETEKYAHVTFFFNGGTEKAFPHEERILVPSPDVATYDLQPEMSAPELTNKLVYAIKNKQHDVIICNYANPDMVGHTGNLKATIKAIETIDKCLEKVVAALHESGGEMLITADHGNAERMFNQDTGQPHTAHTSDPVPFIYVGRNAQINRENGRLSDIAPTMLYLLNLPQPKEMTGESLIKIN